MSVIQYPSKTGQAVVYPGPDQLHPSDRKRQPYFTALRSFYRRWETTSLIKALWTIEAWPDIREIKANGSERPNCGV